MIAALRRLPAWWPAAVAVAATSPLALYWWNLVAAGSVAFDWRIFVEAGHRAWAGSPDLYEQGAVYGYRHSPVFAYAMPLVAWIGTLGIRLVTLAAAVAMPTWPMRVLAIASWPFAMDLQHGGLLTIVVCTAAWALRGSRMAGIGFIVLTLLSPRPLMLPVAIYLLWKQPWLRWPSVGLFAAHAAAVLATGYADEWIAVLLTVGTDQVNTPLNLSPSHFVGNWWLPVGAALATWLTFRGHPGIAALAVNPYVLPHYLLLVLLQLDRRRSSSHANEEVGAS